MGLMGQPGAGGSVSHDFNESLRRSHEQADAPWWEQVYLQAFPKRYSGMRCVRQDGWAQRGGIDRYVDLKDGTTLKVDEKVRDIAWPDFLLERWSDRDRRIPGWAQKDLTCDYIAYAFIPTATCYLLPFQALRTAWILRRQDWVALAEHGLKEPRPQSGRHSGEHGYSVVWADNDRYVTESIAVPINTVLAAVQSALIVTWDQGKVAA